MDVVVTKSFNMYSFEDHIVRITKKDDKVIVGFVDTSETAFDNDIGDALNIDTGCTHLPYSYPASYYPVTIFVKDIKDIEIIE
ncbi:hypothetical protein [Enterococcus mundtii]|uniref:hypothetical protein n=1 Tax=Enterococcus TaxID=1350 RepID=UPI000944E4C9|nr:hypothetical protein [Enterococcus mundtii]